MLATIAWFFVVADPIGESIMAVYVDDMHLSLMGCFRGMKMCHMIADEEVELHRMAGRIGLELRRPLRRTGGDARLGRDVWRH